MSGAVKEEALFSQRRESVHQRLVDTRSRTLPLAGIVWYSSK